MKITVSPAAKNWFVTELELAENAGIRFFGKYGGATNVHTGFTTGMEITSPAEETLGQVEFDQVMFFTNHTDDWFFHGYDLVVDYDANKNEPTYFYTEAN